MTDIIKTWQERNTWAYGDRVTMPDGSTGTIFGTDDAGNFKIGMDMVLLKSEEGEK